MTGTEVNGTEVNKLDPTQKIDYIKLKDKNTVQLDNSKKRAFAYTLNNWTEEEYQQLISIKGVNYHIIGDEIAASGTPHLQGYIVFNNPRSTKIAALKKVFPKRISIAVARKSSEHNFIYCSKEKIKYEYGERPRGQGCRTDLRALANSIKNGTKVDDICLENPKLYHFYGRTLHKTEDILLRKKYRTEMTKGIYYFGKTGVGKSVKAFEGFNPETHYVWPDDGEWWDGYQGQDTVIIDEFRGQIQYGRLLKLMDSHPTTVRRRCREPVPFISKQIIITSSMPPEEVYNNLAENDSLEQFYRRCSIYKMEITKLGFPKITEHKFCSGTKDEQTTVPILEYK